MNILNTNKVDYKKQPLFFGEGLGLQTYQDLKYPALDTLNKRMMELFWKPEEIPLGKDKSDWEKLSDIQKDIFIKNLSYQILLDSVQGRGPVTALLPIVSNPELEGCIITWDFFETIHSRSYTYIIKNLFPNANEVFNEILNIQEILDRAVSITKYYDDLLNVSQRYSANPDMSVSDSDKKTLLMALCAINILEGVRFYVSFACAFAMGELDLMEGNAKIIKLIARDEAMHLGLSQQLIKLLRDREGYEEIFNESIEEIRKLFLDSAKEEKRWAEFLFKDGSMIGLNAEMLSTYVEWIVNRRSSVLGLGKIFEEAPAQNPLPWTDKWLGSKNVQNAPQEVNIDSYLVSSLNMDICEEQIQKLSLF